MSLWSPDGGVWITAKDGALMADEDCGCCDPGTNPCTTLDCVSCPPGRTPRTIGVEITNSEFDFETLASVWTAGSIANPIFTDMPLFRTRGNINGVYTFRQRDDRPTAFPNDRCEYQQQGVDWLVNTINVVDENQFGWKVNPQSLDTVDRPHYDYMEIEIIGNTGGGNNQILFPGFPQRVTDFWEGQSGVFADITNFDETFTISRNWGKITTGNNDPDHITTADVRVFSLPQNPPIQCQPAQIATGTPVYFLDPQPTSVTVTLSGFGNGPTASLGDMTAFNGTYTLPVSPSGQLVSQSVDLGTADMFAAVAGSFNTLTWGLEIEAIYGFEPSGQPDTRSHTVSYFRQLDLQPTQSPSPYANLPALMVGAAPRTSTAVEDIPSGNQFFSVQLISPGTVTIDAVAT